MSVENPTEEQFPKRLDIPTPPDDFFGDSSIETGRLPEWIVFAKTPLFKAMIKSGIEKERVKNDVIEDVFVKQLGYKGFETKTEMLDNAKKIYEMIDSNTLNQDFLNNSENRSLRLWLTHHLNANRTWILHNDFDTHPEMLNSEADFIENQVKGSLRSFAHHYAVEMPEMLPNKYKPLDEEQLYADICTRVRTDIETI